MSAAIPRLPQDSNNCIDRSSSDEILQFRPNNHEELDDSGVCSPPLWKSSPSPSHPLLCLSPNSRRRSIATGQRELMEMLKDMPESSYELSLQDLVEHHRQKMEIDDVESPRLQNRARDRAAVFAKKVKRNRGFEDRGLFLKMGFPFNLQSRKVKRIGDSNNSMSPKPERDWWKKKFTGSSDSESSRVSSDSGRSYGGGSSSQRENEGILSGCWQLFQSKSSKSV
ncbi:Unknown protein [Striga hermonthica]|uniref:Uncharacterized protein n=1 Tax=Striga hermonthica TaxID=68872 RepID=A0A9N7RPM4_STRHE|nr:Unknown protein [Striga hermonthica]